MAGKKSTNKQNLGNSNAPLDFAPSFGRSREKMKLLLFLPLLVLAGCSTNLPVTQYPALNDPVARATIIFYRDGGLSYALKTTFVGVDQYLVSGIKRNEYTSVEVESGKHTVIAVCYDGVSNVVPLPDYIGEKGWNHKVLSLNLSAGETNYINVTPFWSCPEIEQVESFNLDGYMEVKSGSVSERTL